MKTSPETQRALEAKFQVDSVSALKKEKNPASLEQVILALDHVRDIFMRQLLRQNGNTPLVLDNAYKRELERKLENERV